ncbi:uncharacterized protein LOC142616349 [Castanea sativa]|uniref:uncharacterized protein LOC142616349 n=1 Tax=Castanea sativa TaxID=21020 RepID=UPI003F64A6C2
MGGSKNGPIEVSLQEARFEWKIVKMVDLIVQRVTEEYGIEHHKSSLYRPQANGAVEAANKNVKNILVKMVVAYKDWAERLPFDLWGYRTSICASTGVTPYSLVYGSEAVLPIEVEIQSLRVLVETKVLEED